MAPGVFGYHTCERETTLPVVSTCSGPGLLLFLHLRKCDRALAELCQRRALTLCMSGNE